MVQLVLPGNYQLWVGRDVTRYANLESIFLRGLSIVVLIAFIVVGLALWMEVSINPPLWVHFLLWIPLTLVLCLPALRVIKGVLITLQYANKAQEGRWDRPQ